MQIHRRIRIDSDRAGNVLGASVEWWHNGEPHEMICWPAAPFADFGDALEWALAESPSQGVLFQ